MYGNEVDKHDSINAQLKNLLEIIYPYVPTLCVFACEKNVVFCIHQKNGI